MKERTRLVLFTLIGATLPLLTPLCSLWCFPLWLVMLLDVGWLVGGVIAAVAGGVYGALVHRHLKRGVWALLAFIAEALVMYAFGVLAMLLGAFHT